MYAISDHAIKRWRQRIGRPDHTKAAVSKFIEMRGLRPIGRAMPFRRLPNTDYYELHYAGRAVVVAVHGNAIRTFLYSRRLQEPGVFLVEVEHPTRGWVGIYRGPTRWRCRCEVSKMNLGKTRYRITPL